MRLAATMGMALTLMGCAPGTPPATPPPLTVQLPGDVKTASPTVNDPGIAADPCAAERTTLAIESCVAEHLRQIEVDIQAALTRIAGLWSAHGLADAAAFVAASQTDWERYRSSQCLLFEKLSEGGSMARIAVEYCRLDLAQERLATLSSLEHSVVQ